MTQSLFNFNITILVRGLVATVALAIFAILAKVAFQHLWWLRTPSRCKRVHHIHLKNAWDARCIGPFLNPTVTDRGEVFARSTSYLHHKLKIVMMALQFAKTQSAVVRVTKTARGTVSIDNIITASASAPEDCRAFTFADAVYLVGTQFDAKTYSNTPVLVKLDTATHSRVVAVCTLTPHPPWHARSNRHKNWVHVPDDSRILLHTDSYPHWNVVEVVDLTCGKIAPVAHWPGPPIEGLRGTSNWAKLNENEFVTVCHASTRRKFQNSIYSHYFVAADRLTFQPTRWSESVCFAICGESPAVVKHEVIQFCSHLARRNQTNNIFQLGVGINDAGFMIGEVSGEVIDALMNQQF
jgi:hypothetical protein